ncbi:MAG: nuclear transport factor 2 family protein [Hyphomicrobiales bacterium]
MNRDTLPAHARAYVTACETLDAYNVESFLARMTDDVAFVDALNQVQGKEPVRAVFQHLFKTLSGVRFEIRHAAMDGNVLLMTWTFHAAQAAMGSFRFEGASEVTFDDHGLVKRHVDHWDSGREIFGKLPVLGAGFRGILRLFAARTG